VDGGDGLVMTRFTDSQIEEVRSRADIIEIVGSHVPLRRAGRNFVGLCPFHNEKTPSFTVNPERGFYHCFGCGVGGTVFDFLMKIEGLTFPEAVQMLASRYHVALPERNPERLSDQGRAAMFAANQAAAEFYASVLWNTSDGEVARDYLKQRGIAGETARVFMLGFAPARTSSLGAFLYKRGLSEAALRLGLTRRDQSGAVYDMFRNRLMFPIRDGQGRVIAFGGRVLDSRLPKYINSPESPLYSKARALYGLSEARGAVSKTDRVIIVEGYLDVITLWQAGFKETVATLGTALTLDQLRLLARYTRNILACFDGDDAGRKASLRALDVFLQADLLGRGVFIPPGYDPDTLLQERGIDYFSRLLERSELLIEMFLREQARLVPRGRAGTDARARLVAIIADKLRLIKDDELQFNLLVRQAVDLVGFTEREEAVLRRAGRSKLGGQGQVTVSQHQTVIPDASLQAQLGLIAIALRFPELHQQLLSSVSLFAEPRFASLLDEICSTDEPGAHLETRISSRLNEQERGWFSRIMVDSLAEKPADARSLMNDYLKTLNQRRRRSEIAELRRIARATQGEQAVAAAQAVIEARRAGAKR
jgi:DNA primase